MDVHSLITGYCTYQERCQKEVRNKLYELGANHDDVETLIASLIESGFINEERYAKAVARGKFHVKHWGKRKIIYRLKSQDISPYCIEQALKEINNEDYLMAIEKLAEEKWKMLKSERNVYSKKTKTFRYLQQKGFESDFITEAINKLS